MIIGNIISIRQSLLPLLLAQGNRLSCRVNGNVSQFTRSDLMLAPGNQLTQPPDQSCFKSLMADAQFIWVREVVDPHHWLFWYIIPGSVGLVLLAALLATVARRGRGDAKGSEHDFEKAMVACSKLLVPICVLVLPLGCWFWSARQSLYDCGDPVLKLTLAYFSDHKLGSYTLGKAASAAAFFYSIATLCVVHSFRMQMAVIYPRQQHASHPQSVNAVDADSRLQSTSAITQVASLMLYCFVIAGCSAVPILSIMAEYVPGYQSATDAMKPMTSLVAYIKPVAGVLLHIISSFVIPRLARALSGSSRAAVQWMVYSRLFITQLVTVGFTIWLSQDCLGGWLQIFFKQCNDPESFQVEGAVVYSDGYSAPLSLPLTFTRHEQVCGADAGRPGRCLQAIVANLSKLLISKLIITAFVAPCTYLLFWLPCVRRAIFWIKQTVWLRRCLMSCWPWLGQRLGQPTTATTIDTDLVSVIMLLEMAIVYGFAVPMIPVLCLCAVLTHLAVFHVSRVHLQARFTHDAKPVSDYLVFSFVLSNTLNIAYFWTNAERSSAIFVTVSCMGLMVGYFVALVTKAWHWHWHWRNR